MGLSIGSFLNVCIFRLPRGQSLLYPPSHCPHCQAIIKWYDNIPLLSYFLLKRKCRECHFPISPRYPLVEGLTGALFLLSLFHHFPINPGISASYSYLLLLRDLLFISFLIPIFFIDLENQIIPNSLSYGMITAGLIINIFTRSFSLSLLGAGMGAGLFFLIFFLGSFFLREEAMGMGDIKLAAGTGAFLGWKLGLICFFLSFFLGAVISIVLLLTHIKKRRDRIPFAPFLVGGALISLFLGDKILYFYLTFPYY